MIVRIFRIAKSEYIDDFTGEGARLYGGRWNLVGDPMLYFSQSLSLSLLEIIVHVEFAKLPVGYSFLEVEISDKFIKPIQSLDFIKPKWSSEEAEKTSADVGVFLAQAARKLGAPRAIGHFGTGA